ncbi:MAG: amidohydrolase, partial [Deltaproteobacteria bacterium]|nr:amidohydrolase [Deltaproteobacteria bacterium]
QITMEDQSMKRPFPVIDADGHVIENIQQFREFLPEHFHGEDGKREYVLFPRDGWARGALTPRKRENPDAKRWLEFIDSCGIDATVLYTSAGLALGLLHDADFAVVLARAYNDWLHEFYLRVSPHFQGMALLPVQDPAEAAKELERCVNDLGMVGGMLVAVMNPMRGYGLPQFDPIYETAQRLDVPLGVHAGVAAELGLDHMTSFAGVYPLSHPFAQMQQLTSMMIHGVFERFPRLRVAFLEAGCGWVPYLMDRLDESWEHRISRWPHKAKKAPGEIMTGGNLYYSCEVGERTLDTVAKLMGETQLLWPSDFPHEKPWDEFSGDLDQFIRRDDLSESAARHILWENPCRLYGLSEKTFAENRRAGPEIAATARA